MQDLSRATRTEWGLGLGSTVTGGGGGAACSPLTAFERANQRQRVSRIPIRSARDDAQFATVLVDQHRHRKAQRLAALAQGLERVAAWVGVARKRLDADAIQKRTAALEPRAVDVDRLDLKTLVAGLSLKAVERRYFGPAGRAPGRPEVEEHCAPAKIGDGRLAAVLAFEDERNGLARLGRDRKGGDSALGERRKFRRQRLRGGRTG